MNQIALVVAALIFLVLGSFHGLLALRDVFRPTTFTPVDDSVRKAMEGVPLALHPKTDLWKAWLGFNLSHSLGLILFGGVLLAVAVVDMELFAHSLLLQLIVIAVSIVYVVLALGFWFIVPVIGTTLATLCLVAASVLS